MTDWFGYYAVLPSLLVFACLLAVAATPMFRGADSPPIPAAHRDVAIDGLRGFLAVAVVIQHLELSVHSTLIGEGPLPSAYYQIFGQAGVAAFFMITGYLFWTKMLTSAGRIDWTALYVGRLFRLLPLYYVLVALSVAIVLTDTGTSLAVPPATLARTLLKLSAGGLFGVSSFNGDGLFASLTGPVWTLRYEWLFYGSLLLTGQLCRSRRLGLMMPPVMLVLLAIHARHGASAVEATPAICVLEFLIGMSVACFRRAFPAWRLREPLGSAAMAALLLLSFGWFGNAVQVRPVLVLGLFFALVASGHTLFGLLRTRPARRLGDVSYGIYLLQGPVGWVAVRLDPTSARTPLAHWGHVLATLIALVIVATVAHVLVERPGIDAGRRVRRLLRRGIPPLARMPRRA